MAHDHGIKNYNRSFAVGVLLNIIFVLIEGGYGFKTGSLALVADAGHNFSDVLSLLLAWGAVFMAGKSSSVNRTYGYKRITILASLTSALLLLFALGGITWEAIGRMLSPQPVPGLPVVIVAAIGVVINTATALLFVSGQKHDLNIKGAFLHMAADAGISLGVVAAGGAIIVTGWEWIDPTITVFIVIIVLIGTWGLLRDSFNLSLDAVPKGINIKEIENYLRNLSDIEDIHDLHVWALSTTEAALTVHLISKKNMIDNQLLHDIEHQLHDKFGIEHATIQMEFAEDNNCSLNKPACT